MTDEVQAGGEGVAGTNTAAQPTASTATAGTATERQRGADGRFAAKEGGTEAPAAQATPGAGQAQPAQARTVAAGNGQAQTQPPAAVESTWPSDWRERMARTHAGQDEKAYAKELKRLQMFADPAAIYGWGREADRKFSEGGLTKIPGPKATDEERAAWRKALGIPDEAKGYSDKLKLANNRVLGENDKPVFDFFAERMHKADVTPQQMSALTDAWLDYQTDRAAQQDVDDAQYHDQSIDSLRREWGGSFEKNAGAISTLFATAPQGVQDLLLNGRTADGHKLGDHPDVVRFLAGLALELNPAATLVGPAESGSAGVESRIAEIEKVMRTDRRAYDKNPALQAELRDLYSAREKYRARNRAA